MLTDPCYFLEPLFSQVLFHFPPRKITKDTFGQLDYVYSSHVHVDHSHPETLKQLKEQVKTVLLPAKRPDLEKRYRDIGYDNIILLENGETLKLREEIEVTSYWDDLVDTILLIKIKDKVILHQNDCLLRPKTLAKIAERFSIAYAFMLYTHFADIQPTLLYDRPEEISKLVVEAEANCLKYQIEFIKALNPKTIIPYSMTLSHCQPDQLYLNGYQRMIPNIFKEKILAHLPKVRFCIMQPGDILDLESGQVKFTHNKNLWGNNLEDFLDNIAEFINNPENKITKFDYGDPERFQAKFESFLKQRLSLPFSSIFKNKVILIELRGNTNSICYSLDIEQKKFFVITSNPRFNYNNYFLKLSVPTSILEQLILKKCEPSTFSFVLYSNKVFLQINHHNKLSIKAQLGLFNQTLMAIFGNQLLSQTEKNCV